MRGDTSRRVIGSAVALILIWGVLVGSFAHHDAALLTGPPDVAIGAPAPTGPGLASPICLACLLTSTAHATLEASPAAPHPHLVTTVVPAACCVRSTLRALRLSTRGPPRV
ncbi:MAG: hypothetical protein ACE5IK_01960 [Acidobacteriota bacterium]